MVFTTSRRGISFLLMTIGLLPIGMAQQQPSWRENVALTGNLVLGGYAFDVAIDNGRAYVLTRESESSPKFIAETWISVIDIQNPAQPRFLYALPVSNRRRQIVMSGNRAAVFGERNDVDLIDFNSTVPTVHTLETQAYVTSGAIDGNLLFFRDAENDVPLIRILDIANVSAPVQRGVIWGIETGAVAARDGTVYFQETHSGTDTLFTYRLNNPVNPQFLGGFNTPTQSILPTLRVQGRLAFSWNSYFNHLTLLNVSNPAEVFPYPLIDLSPIDVAPLPSIAYVSNQAEIMVIDTTDLFSEDLIRGKFQTLAPAVALDTYGTYCVAACGYRGVLIAHYTGPGAPVRFTQPLSETYSLNNTIPVQVTTGGGAGKAMRLELWRDSQRVKVLGTFWNPNGDHTLSIPANVMATTPGTGYFLRAVGLWNTSLFGDSRLFSIAQ